MLFPTLAPRCSPIQSSELCTSIILFDCLGPSRPRRVRIMTSLVKVVWRIRSSCSVLSLLRFTNRRSGRWPGGDDGLFAPFPCRHQVQLRREMFQSDSFLEKVWTLFKSSLPLWTSSATFTIRLLEPWHLEEDYPITTFFESKRFSSFFANGPIKSKVQLCKRWKL